MADDKKEIDKELQAAAETEAVQAAETETEAGANVDHSFMARKIQKREEMIVAYSLFTGKPFAICDPETFDDEVWIFENEELLQEFAKPYLEQKIALRGMKFLNKDFLRFFSGLYTLGINKLVFVDESGTTKMDLDKLVREPDYSSLPEQRRPLLNPSLQLTGMYFMQEVGRPIPNEEKPALKELEEELAANMYKAKYLLCVELEDGPEDVATKLKERKYKIPILKDKNENVYQPAFTDPLEFERFAKGKKLNAMVVTFQNMSRLLAKEAKGYMLNPSGYHILMPRELLDTLAKRFQ